MDHDITEGAGVFNNSQIQELRPWEMRAVSVFFPLSWDRPSSHPICSETFVSPPSQFKSFANFCVINLIMHPKYTPFPLADSCSSPHSASRQLTAWTRQPRSVPSFLHFQSCKQRVWNISELRFVLAIVETKVTLAFLLSIGYFVSHELNQGQIIWAR